MAFVVALSFHSFFNSSACCHAEGSPAQSAGKGKLGHMEPLPGSTSYFPYWSLSALPPPPLMLVALFIKITVRPPTWSSCIKWKPNNMLTNDASWDCGLQS